eukprot:5791055-Amphidinium_carterae.1
MMRIPLHVASHISFKAAVRQPLLQEVSKSHYLWKLHGKRWPGITGTNYDTKKNVHKCMREFELTCSDRLSASTCSTCVERKKPCEASAQAAFASDSTFKSS